MPLLVSLGAFRIYNYLSQPDNSYESSDTERSPQVFDLRAITIPHPTAPSSFMHICALLLETSLGNDPSSCRLESPQSLVELLPSLRIAVLWYGRDFPSLKVTANAIPALCVPLSSTRDITYRILCERWVNHPFAEVPKVYDGYNEVIEINPITMEPTGARLIRFHPLVLTDFDTRSGLGTCL